MLREPKYGYARRSETREPYYKYRESRFGQPEYFRREGEDAEEGRKRAKRLQRHSLVNQEIIVVAFV